MGDSHERKAAVELQGLRDDLAKLGFGRIEPVKEEIPSQRRGDSRFRVIRLTRQTRTTRLAPVQRLIQVVEEAVRWLGEKIAFEAPAQKPIVQTTPKPSWREIRKQAQPLKRPLTVGEAFDQKRALRRRPPIIIQPESDSGHSRGIGV